MEQDTKESISVISILISIFLVGAVIGYGIKFRTTDSTPHADLVAAIYYNFDTGLATNLLNYCREEKCKAGIEITAPMQANVKMLGYPEKVRTDHYYDFVFHFGTTTYGMSWDEFKAKLADKEIK